MPVATIAMPVDARECKLESGTRLEPKEKLEKRPSLEGVVNGIDVAFSGVTYSVMVKAKPLIIIDNLSGLFRAGRMSALMGPSGSGKVAA